MFHFNTKQCDKILNIISCVTNVYSHDNSSCDFHLQNIHDVNQVTYIKILLVKNV